MQKRKCRGVLWQSKWPLMWRAKRERWGGSEGTNGADTSLSVGAVGVPWQFGSSFQLCDRSLEVKTYVELTSKYSKECHSAFRVKPFPMGSH
jgi:hypothetical protein